jgi:putative 4-mercaptohistidine N1-methyltranferase
MSNPYESAKLVSEYLWFHYPPPSDGGGIPLPAQALDFPRRVVSELMDASRPVARALDIGCAVGRSSFELSRHANEVLGIDFSRAFIDAADRLRAGQALDGEIPIEGTRKLAFTASVPEGTVPERVSFEVGDATALRPDLGAFDLVLAANLLCRLPSPRAFLDRLPSLVNPGGQLLLATPFSWLPEYTAESEWIGGREGGPASREVLEEILTPHFELELERDLPFLIREHSRKYQYGISLGTRWRRR